MNVVDEPFMSMRDMVTEIRDDMKSLRKELGLHLGEFEDHKLTVVTKMELNLMQEVKKATRRYMIATAIAIGSLIITMAGVIITSRPG